jgi:hypothetical protein
MARRRVVSVVAAFLMGTVLVGPIGLGAMDPAAAAVPRAAGAGHTVWLCRPGLADNPCAADRTATLVAADGATHTQRAITAKSRPVDCFYVYPTVSLQPTMNANLNIDPNQISVAIAQASRFSQVCRVYAPIYRQLTLAAIGGGATRANAALAYGDVRSAWRDYLAHYNDGRGVVLIGHSQGAGMLTQLVKQEIDPNKKARRRLTSALLLGGNVLVPRGKDVGGDFKHVKACRSPKQTGCVVAYSTFKEPPPANAIFGRSNTGFNQVRGGGTAASKSEVLCTNPASLRGGTAVAHPYFPTHLNLGVLGGALPADVLAATPTPWVSYPGLYKISCRNEHGASWLQVDDQRQAGDTRPELINSLGATWGLHLVDVNIDQGDLVALVARQGAAWSDNH